VPGFKKYYLPLLAWVAVLLTFAVISLPEAPQLARLNVDKMRHAAAYGLLGALAARAAAGAAARGGTFAFVVAFFFVFGVGLGTEFLQASVPERTADVVDLAADLAGGVIGALAFLWAFTGGARAVPERPA
jgi:VanZ family protein